MSFNTIKTEERDGIYIITLNRPKAKNAMNSEMWQELCWAFDHLDETDSLRCCIITNAGDCFCAGSDLKELPQAPIMLLRGMRKAGSAA